MGVGLFGLAGAIFTLLLISRTYTTALQDRIIKLEMRVRCASLLTPQQQAIAARLDETAAGGAAVRVRRRAAAARSNARTASG